MKETWLPSVGNAEDSGATASLSALSWASLFARLQFGRIDTLVLAAAMAPRIAQQISSASATFVVIRDPNTHEVVLVAQWSRPLNKSAFMEETQEERDERQAFDDEPYRSSLPENSNKDLIMEFTVGVRSLKHRALQGREHYALNNLATHSDYRKRGLTSRLVERIFPHADADEAEVYLEVDSDNPAIRMYRKLGSEERGRYTIGVLGRFASGKELEEHGGNLEHTHVAFVRMPQRGS